MKKSSSVTYLHLKLPTTMLESIKPTGCRQSPESEISWRLTAGIEALRQLAKQKVLPILKGESPYDVEYKSAEVNVRLLKSDKDLLTAISKEEGGSRGKLARELLRAVAFVLEHSPVNLTQEGLANEVVSLFSQDMLAL